MSRILGLFFLLWFSSLLQSLEPTPKNQEQIARLDAVEQLEDFILALPISSNVNVGDFVNSNKTLKKEFSDFLLRTESINEKYALDGTTYQTTLVITLRRVVSKLCEFYYLYPSPLFSPEKLLQLRYHTTQRVFCATGIASTSKRHGVWKYICKRGKKMALRTAKINAYRHLAQVIKSLPIHSGVTVNDFIEENEEIRAAFYLFVYKASVSHDPIYHPEGVVEITISIHTKRVVASLRKIYFEHYYGNEWHPYFFSKISKYSQIIQAKGTGTPPARYCNRLQQRK